MNQYKYKETLDLEKDAVHFDVRVIKDAELFEVPKYVDQSASFETMFTEKPKYGDKFGPLYSTHMFWLRLTVAKKWLEDPDAEVHFIWEAECEASLYNIETGRHLQALSQNENLRNVYHIKVGPCDRRNDLADKTIVVGETESSITVQYLLEMACQEMFGNFVGNNKWGNGKVDMDK